VGPDTTIEKSSAGAQAETRPLAHLVRLLDCGRPLVPSSRHALVGVDSVRIGRGPLGAERAGGELRLAIDDGRISTAHARLKRVVGRWLLEDLGSKNGTLVAGAPVQTAALSDGDVIEIGRTFFLYRDGVPTAATDPLDETAGDDSLATLSPPLASALRALALVARSDIPVIVHGESGTGKELVARAVHEQSGRRGPFVAVNCGAIPEALVASELFGVRRGAFSDAREDRPGLIRSAHKGTLFLDEIGDLPLGSQVAFLRALQEREVVPVGQAQSVAVDVRVVSASHRDLEERILAGAFREDLAARLTGFTLRLPPLRARREDLGLIVAALVRKLAPEPERVAFQPEAMRLLLGHSWPRNVRELERQLATALVLAGGGPIGVAHLGDLRAPAVAPKPVDDPRRAELERLLTEHRGNLAAVARAMGKDRVQVRRWLQRYGVDPTLFRR
jgi:DNA-binding NtrC family response regulator